MKLQWLGFKLDGPGFECRQQQEIVSSQNRSDRLRCPAKAKPPWAEIDTSR